MTAAIFRRQTTNYNGELMFEYDKTELAQEYHLYKKALKFLDDEFKGLLTPVEVKEWRTVRHAVRDMAQRIRKEHESVPYQMSHVIAFRAFEEAIDSESSQLCPVLTGTVEDWWDEIRMDIAPLAHELVSMCFDIGRGFSKKEAKKFHQQWLDEDEDNRIFGHYFYASDGSVVPIGEDVAEA